MRAEDDLPSLIEFCAHQLVTAGDYASRVQSRVRSHAPKEVADTGYSTAFTQALTDADMSVQTFLEVALLSRYGDLAWDPEEESFNLPYFDESAALKLICDPINGTRYYAANMPQYDMVIAAARGEQIVAAVDYIPSRQQLYWAIEGQGAFTISREALLAGAQPEPLKLSLSERRIFVYQTPDLEEKLLAAGHEVSDLEREFSHDPRDGATWHILSGEAGGWLRRGGHARDWGAVAFIAQQAGGIATDFVGRPIEKLYPEPDQRPPQLVVTADAEFHASVIAALQ